VRPISLTVTRGRDDVTVHQSYCRICGAMCGITVSVEGDAVTEVRGDPDHPMSRGYTCSKGRALPAMHHSPRRLLHPMIRRNGTLVETTWEECLDDLAARLREASALAGPDAVGAYLGTACYQDALGAQAVYRLLGALGSSSRYSSLTVDAAAKMLVAQLVGGQPLLTPQIDVPNARLVILAGTNPVVSHGQTTAWPDPVNRLRELRTHAEIWVLDPRRTATARLADRHLAPRGGTDYAIFAWLIRELLRDGADHEYLTRYTVGAADLAAAVEPHTLEATVEMCDVGRGDLEDLLAAVRKAGRISGMTGTGLTMGRSPSVTEWLFWALHIVTGSMDRPGGVWFNPGFLLQLDRRRTRGRSILGAGPKSRPELRSLNGEYPCVALPDEVSAGNLRSLLVIGGNPITAHPDPARVTAALEALDVVAVADVVENEVTARATHVLAVTDQFERTDMPLMLDMYASAVMTQYGRAIVTPAGDQRPLWWVLGHLARRLGLDLVDGGDLDTLTEDDLLAPVVNRSRGAWDEVTSAPTAVVAEQESFGWVHEHVLPDGRWQLAPAELVVQLATLPAPAPLVFIPGRAPREMNSQAEPGAPTPAISLSPDDAASAGVRSGQPVEIRSDHGRLIGIARVDDNLRAGVVTSPHGWIDLNACELLSGHDDVDELTGMPLMSGVPITIRPAADAT
jgi:anaerobic selenocysteine-containing dehydrogenase